MRDLERRINDIPIWFHGRYSPGSAGWAKIDKRHRPRASTACPHIFFPPPLHASHSPFQFFVNHSANLTAKTDTILQQLFLNDYRIIPLLPPSPRSALPRLDFFKSRRERRTIAIRFPFGALRDTKAYVRNDKVERIASRT